MKTNPGGVGYRFAWLAMVAIVMALCSGPLLLAQGQGGQASLTGTVLDAQGGVVPSATVQAKNTETGRVSKTITNTQGLYVFPVLDVGIYDVSASQTGFKTQAISGIQLNVNQQSNLNITLAVGDVRQTVSVQASAEQLRPVNGTLSSVIQQKAIVDLPLENRNPASLVFLSAGMMNGGRTVAGQNQGLTTYPGEQIAFANGGRQGSTYYMLDGTNNMDTYLNLTAPFPNPEAIQEFRVLLNNFDAQYGYSPGAVVSIASRTGSNVWHGDLFEFLRNDALNARSFFSPTRDTLKRNQYGGSLGGPIKHDKLFVFGNFQRTDVRQTLTGSELYSINNAHRNGNFSDWAARGDSQPIDPDTGLPFPGDQIPTQRFNPVMVGLLPGLPATDAVSGRFFSGGGLSTSDENMFMTRGDWNINDKQRAFVRYFHTNSVLPGQTAGGNLFLQSSSWDATYWNIAGNHTWMLSPALVNSFTFSWNRTNSFAVQPLTLPGGTQANLASLGANIAYPTQYPPMINSLYFVDFGFGGDLNENFRRNYTITDSLNWIKGKHLIVTGLDILGQSSQIASDYGMNGFVNGGNFYGTMNTDANFLLGLLDSFTQNGGQFNSVTSTNWDAYINDTYKLKPNLSLTMGVRWEPFVGPNWGGDKMVDWVPGAQSTRFPLAPVGLLYLGDPGVPKHAFNSQYNRFYPRGGFSWQPGGHHNTFIRGAVGLFAGPFAHRLFENVVAGPFNPSVAVHRTDSYVPNGVLSISDPFANFPGGNPYPAAFSCYTCVGDPTTPFVSPQGVVSIFTPDFKGPRTVSWNGSIEHHFEGDILVRAAYVASHSWNEPVVRDLNWATNNVRPNPLYSVIDAYTDQLYSNYRSMQLTFEKKFTRNIQLESNFTWSQTKDVNSVGSTFAARLHDPRSIDANYAISDYDISRVWVTNFIYMLPTPHSLQNRFARGVLGGWEASGIWTLESGLPFTVYWAGNRSQTLNAYDRADLTGTPVVYQQGTENRLHYVNRDAFEPNALGTYGTSVRNAYRMPGYTNIDFGFYKNFPFKERGNVQFRVAAFNLFNQPVLGFINAPTSQTSASSSLFGQLSSQRNGPRILQLGIKIMF
jgi:Carboxypeptidase regulatory-like domain